MSHHWGYVSVLTAAVLFGISTTLNKIALADVHPIVVAGAIYLVAGISLTVIRVLPPLHGKILSLLETPTETEPQITMKDYVILGFVILFGSIIAPYLFIYGLDETTAINASLLSNSESLFTALIAFLFLGERGKTKDYTAIFLVLLGAVILTTNAEFQKLSLTKDVFGNLLVLAACFSWSIDNNLSRFLSVKKDIVLITALKCLLGGTALLATAWLLQVVIYVPMKAVLYLVLTGALSIGVSVLLFLFALREIGAMKTGILFATSSLFGALTAFLVLKENFTLVQLAAAALMLTGVWLMYKRQ